MYLCWIHELIPHIFGCFIRSSLADGVAIPHGLYDLSLNIGDVQIGNSHDTGEFACDSIRDWWTHYGSIQYPKASSILILCDGGGSNSSRHYLFKQDLQAYRRLLLVFE